MKKINKKELSETDICDLYITPSIKKAGYDPFIQIRREVNLTPGRIDVFGLTARRNKKTRKRADYVLYKKQNIPIGVIEAKSNNFKVSDGMPQAIKYASLLNVPSAFSSNGDAFSYLDMCSENKELEKNLSLDEFVKPNILWEKYLKFNKIQTNQEEINLEDYYTEENKEPRYYQVNAINSLIREISKDKKRLLIVMATGTGKTYVAFQTIWRLWKSKKIKRALFLADRNILVDQSIVNDFKPFKNVITKIKNRNADPSYQIYMALYQSLTGEDEASKIYKNFSKDFFDLIVIDECHRGSASDESQWREILEYFNSAIQIGMTATPKETKYISNIEYFGNPIYSYSLKQGIEDGFLSPYKLIRINIDKDLEGWMPPPGMTDDFGMLIEDRKYNQTDMDRILILNHRTKIVAKRIMEYLKITNPYDKTIIFCENIDHAERMRKAIINEAGEFVKKHYNYVVRITGDNPETPEHLDDFIDPENKLPVIAITSKLMSTGVDARTCKNIILDKNINSMTEFKQIIGRGTRVLEEKNKLFFTILDFKNATRNFFEPEFDGEPVSIKEINNNEIQNDLDDTNDDNDDDRENDDKENKEIKKYYINDLEVSILSEQIQYLDDGKLITKNLKDFSKDKVLKKFSTLDEFINTWKKSEKKKIIIEELKNDGIFFEELRKDLGSDYEPFDIICNLVFNKKPLTRRERALKTVKSDNFSKYSEAAKKILRSLLEKYAEEGIEQIEDTEILKIPPFSNIGTPLEILEIFGGLEKYKIALNNLTTNIYTND